MTELIHRTRLDGGVLLAEVDRPPANAYDFELLDAVEALAADAEARVVVLASRLERIFCAGADLGAFLDLDPERRSDLCARCREAQNAIECSPRPFLALIEGACLGGGAEIALSCDVRFMARGARIGFPEVKLGLLPASGGTQNLPRRVGRGRALDLLLSGRSLDADEALAAGLVEHVGEAEAVRNAALDLAARIAGMPAEAVSAIKDAVVRGLRVSLAEGMTLELEHVGQRFADPRTDPRLREALAAGRGRGERH
jgi:enoyl-CoA hydratase/carnithine racemase